jgi:XTP/dITP diphosphohydrolase
VRVLAATANPDKLEELRFVFAPFGWTVEPFEGYAAPDEGETSYRENAAIKARALAKRLAARGGPRVAVVADDSGFEVRALGNRPGVTSARYGGPGATWPQRRALVLRELAATGGANRDARFVCAMHLIDAGGREYASEAFVPGRVALGERGAYGFGYDAIFEYPPLGCTFGELPMRRKNEISHRALAARALVEAASADAAAGM